MTIDELRRASALLRTIAEAEVARLEGDEARVASLLDGVDPVEAYALAHIATFEAGVGELMKGTRLVERVHIRTPW